MNAGRSISTSPPPRAPGAPAAATATVLTDGADPASVPLPDDVAVLHAMIRELLLAMRQTRHERDGLQERLDLLLRKLYGPKAERFNPNQPWLLPELAPGAADPHAAAAAEAATAAAGADEPVKKKGHGRQRLPADLRRQRVEHTLAEAERICPCCGEVCPKFGEEVT